MTWEIADRDHPTRACSRFHELARASEEVEKCQPRERFYLRWVAENGQADDTRRMADNG